MRAGTAKVDITSPEDALPTGYKAIRDHVYARAIVLDNQKTKAVLLSADLVMFADDFYEELVQEIEQEVGCPIENILISAIHTHGSPVPNSKPVPGLKSNAFLSFDVAYAERIKKGVIEAVRQAKTNLQPARVGNGTGQFYMNVNRDAVHPDTRTWYQGSNLDGPSDKTVAVAKFESLSGELIAVYINYAMHANLMYMSNEIGGGFTRRRHHDISKRSMMSKWLLSGLTGQQVIRYHFTCGWLNRPSPRKNVPNSRLLAGIRKTSSNWRILSMQRSIPRALKLGTRLIDRIGQLLGEEVIRVMENITRTSAKIRLWGTHQIISCPGRRRIDSGREGAQGLYEDADPINLRLGLLVIDQIALVAVTGEPYTSIGQRLKKIAPYGNTVLVTLANGRSVGYIHNDAAYERQTFQVLGARIRKVVLKMLL